MKIVYEHNLGAGEAYERIGQIIGRLQDDYGGQITSYRYSWSADHRVMDYSIRAMGAETTGKISLDDRNMTIEGSIPLMVRLIFSESRLERLVREQLDLLFAGDSPNIDLNRL